MTSSFPHRCMAWCLVTSLHAAGLHRWKAGSLWNTVKALCLCWVTSCVPKGLLSQCLLPSKSWHWEMSVLSTLKSQGWRNAQPKMKECPSKTSRWLSENKPLTSQYVTQLTGNHLRKYPFKCHQHEIIMLSE